MIDLEVVNRSVVDRVLPYIGTVPNFPKIGVDFKDISPLLNDAEAFKITCEALSAVTHNWLFSSVAGIEARGFILGAPIALSTNCGFVPLRKRGKLPGNLYSKSYGLEYGTDTIEMQVHSFNRGQRVLVVDDVLATGGTAMAACDLIEQAGGVVAGCVFLAEISALHGRNKLSKYNVYSLIRY